MHNKLVLFIDLIVECAFFQVVRYCDIFKWSVIATFSDVLELNLVPNQLEAAQTKLTMTINIQKKSIRLIMIYC